MRDESRDLVDLWVGDLLGLPAKLLWQSGVTVGFQAGLGDLDAIMVTSRAGAVHVCLPEEAGARLVDELVEVPAHDLASPDFWKHHPLGNDHKILPPQVHAFADTELKEPKGVERILASDISEWSEVMSRKKWHNSGFDAEVPVVFGIRHHDQIAAVAGLRAFRGVPSDVIVLTHPKYRGKGHSGRVARAAAAYAVKNHGLARMRYDADNQRMAGLASSLGFEPYFEQFAVVPRG